ncbi:hypothetical protein OsJ_12606 [Oryza sativa Japonica Group]|uniref:Uncharacterized protein n=1 Tax=Oryza sativa subsp. japonica TaxID=39947 RepID=B9FBV6_ORYSJ|nr:hypothetical protein OsJ_12606 [Oryza sativa Japonica Group]
MAHRGGGGRGVRGGEQQQRPPYSGRADPGRGGGGGGGAPPYRPATGSVWPPPGMTPRPGPPPPQYPQPGPPAVVHGEPMPALHHQASYQPGAVYRAPSPGVPVPLGGYARSTPVTIRGASAVALVGSGSVPAGGRAGFLVVLLGAVCHGSGQGGRAEAVRVGDRAGATGSGGVGRGRAGWRGVGGVGQGSCARCPKEGARQPCAARGSERPERR